MVFGDSSNIAKKINHQAYRKLYLVIICPNSYDKRPLHMWSLFVPLSMKFTLGIHICGHYLCQLMSKVDQKQNWVKLKSVRTLLRIACLANRKSYMWTLYMLYVPIQSIHVKNCSKVKMKQAE